MIEPVPAAAVQRDADRPRVGYLVARLERAVRREIAARIGEHGLSIPQYTALSILRDRTGLSNAQLARRTFVTPQSMNEVVASLEQGGYIERSPDTNHRRILRSALTVKGEDVLARCDATVLEMETIMLRDLSGDEQAWLVDALVSCVQAMHELRDDA